ncbi:cytochrome P450 [Pirellula staleyi DSM 6068]|uniref:Cytochrome P450 n=1 Tax=Pirellula staleyi (strain ATCC 27377 / DSM 6068 / ICPB 4128) TaxID=530564 RepID=D2R617_PIRSD|nr:cytochrome P450 [Pirellula staleyi]ADB19102.1 cytochrome P450 [Pirellula staleyi DSM 6068]
MSILHALAIDRYALYSQLRATPGIAYNDEMGYWLVARYDDIRTVLASEDFASNRLTHYYNQLDSSVRESAASLFRLLGHRLLFTDGDRRRRLKTALGAAFLPARMRMAQSVVISELKKVVDHIDLNDSWNAVECFCTKLSTNVFAQVLGLPPADFSKLRQWTSDIYEFLGFSFVPLDQRLICAVDAAQKVDEYLTPLIHRHNGVVPRDSILGEWIFHRASGGGLSETEIVSNVVGVVSAGLQTTTDLLFNAMLLFSSNKSQYSLLQDERALLPNAIEETARLESPIQMSARQATRDSLLSGTIIPQGNNVVLLFGSGNRDENAFSSPGTMDVKRDVSGHLGFGWGVHYCLGAPLARIIAITACDWMLDNIDNISFEAGTVVWHANPVFRGAERAIVSVAKRNRGVV